ncbi:transcriptional regulator [Stutzerimonas zhaodongensis]|uniref:Transcriptional regulator n=1 Tax=Stutzerimonas zhaodongensis TaxID=1176257 RepID=A0A3M2HLB0_9GAMM|nr:helix-turn-helix domain-containing protein [Stutzerimonas zhaodongensis]MCQ4316059.1 helix-turn-helix transcriptional regulator [Stutzerimonas zhaodongensis]RMH89135.1 transcriptional regulator [Stutzerimonas zhaodongensis]
MTQDHSQNAPFDQPCPIRDVLDRIGDQWSFLVLEALAERTLRFNELSREIGDISKQMLSRTLKRLEMDGFVERTVFPEVPPRVEYNLTDMGRSFLVPMQALIKWADAYHGQVCSSRRAFRSSEDVTRKSV